MMTEPTEKRNDKGEGNRDMRWAHKYINKFAVRIYETRRCRSQRANRMTELVCYPAATWGHKYINMSTTMNLGIKEFRDYLKTFNWLNLLYLFDWFDWYRNVKSVLSV